MPSAGRLFLAGPHLKKVSRRIAREGTATLPLRARGRALQTLTAKGILKVKARVTFRPVGGSPRVETAHLTLVLR